MSREGSTYICYLTLMSTPPYKESPARVRHEQAFLEIMYFFQVRKGPLGAHLS